MLTLLIKDYNTHATNILTLLKLIC